MHRIHGAYLEWFSKWYPGIHFAPENNSWHLNGWLEYWNTMLSLLGQAHPIFQGLHTVTPAKNKHMSPKKGLFQKGKDRRPTIICSMDMLVLGGVVLRECIHLQFPTPSVGCDCWKKVRGVRWSTARNESMHGTGWLSQWESKGPTPQCHVSPKNW